MKPAEAATLIRRWLEKHGRAVEMALVRSGVPSSADRADLEQEVFTTAFLALLRGEDIDNPRAWLKECARKKASNYRRKESRRAPPASGKEVVSTMASPEQLAEDREALCLAFECIDEELQEIVLAVRAEGLSWDDIARERGITVARAKYLYAMAVTQMEAALNREDSRTDKRRLVPFPVLLIEVFDAIRSEVDNVSPELDRRVREGLDRFMESAVAGATDPESERVSIARPSPSSIQLTTPPAPSMSIGPVLGILGSGIVIGVALGYLLHGVTPGKPLHEPSHTRSIPVLAMRESAEKMGEAGAPAPSSSANGSRMLPGQLLAQNNQAAPSASTAVALKETSSPASLALLDLARVAFQDGNARAALALLTQHARSFPGKPNEKERRALVQLVCAAPAARGAAECADVRSHSAPK